MDPDPTPLPLDTPQLEGRPPVRCKVCGAPLTARKARLWGMGRDCRRKLG
ncbi:DUF6011 domain-containing protein [Actinacidiphila soli]|nr:DUF6011 domain-containing protein [Actinacidiphila soli]